MKKDPGFRLKKTQRLDRTNADGLRSRGQVDAASVSGSGVLREQPKFGRKVAGQAEPSMPSSGSRAADSSFGRQRCDIADGPAAVEVLRCSPCADERPFEIDRQDAVPVG